MGTHQQRSSEQTLYVNGDISRANAAQIEAQLLLDIEQTDCQSLRLNLGQVQFIDSAGFRTLSTLYFWARQQNKSLAICEVTPPVRLVFEMTGLDQILSCSSQENRPSNRPSPSQQTDYGNHHIASSAAATSLFG